MQKKAQQDDLKSALKTIASGTSLALLMRNAWAEWVTNCALFQTVACN
jgi:hypothetical protein